MTAGPSPLVLGTSPKRIIQLAVSTQILVKMMVIYVLRNHEAHNKSKKLPTFAIYEVIFTFCKLLPLEPRRTILSFISAEDIIGYWENPRICAAPHLYPYCLEAAVKKSTLRE